MKYKVEVLDLSVEADKEKYETFKEVHDMQRHIHYQMLSLGDEKYAIVMTDEEIDVDQAWECYKEFEITGENTWDDEDISSRIERVLPLIKGAHSGMCLVDNILYPIFSLSGFKKGTSSLRQMRKARGALWQVMKLIKASLKLRGEEKKTNA